MWALVRARDEASGAERIRAAMRRYGSWSDRYDGRITALPGDLDAPALGVDAILPRVHLRLQVSGDRAKFRAFLATRDQVAAMFNIVEP